MRESRKVQEDERKLILGNRLTCSMAILANFTVFAFLYSYHVLDSVISRILFTAEVVGGQEYILHIDNMRLSDLFSYQLVTFIAAAKGYGKLVPWSHLYVTRSPCRMSGTPICR